MSIKIMSAVWELDGIDGTECLVLLALADHADDEGRCYPSISRLAKRTKLSDRGVQKVLSRLIEKGFVRVVPCAGQSGANVYFVTATPEPCSPPEPRSPRTEFTTPPNHVRRTPEPRSPKPSLTTIEPSENTRVRNALRSVLSQEAATAFMEHRKAKRSKLTPHAAELIAKKLADHPAPDAVIEASILNGWTGIFPEKIGGPHEPSHHDRRAAANSDALRNTLDAAARMRRSSQADFL